MTALRLNSSVNLVPDISSSLLPKLPIKASTNLGAIQFNVLRYDVTFSNTAAPSNGIELRPSETDLQCAVTKFDHVKHKNNPAPDGLVYIGLTCLTSRQPPYDRE